MLPANYTFTAADDGTHTFTVTFKTAGTQAITATDTSNPAIIGTEENIIVPPAAAQSLKVTGFPTTDTAGTPETFTVTAYDAYGNVATGYTGTVQFTSSDSQAVLPADVHHHPRGARDVHLHRHAQDGGDAVDHRHRHGDVEHHGHRVGHRRPARRGRTRSWSPASRPPTPRAVPGNFTVTAYDPYGNVATGYTGTVPLHQQRSAGRPAGQLHVYID